MTLRRQQRELYRVFSEDEFLHLADWQPGASLAGKAEVAVRLPRAGRTPSDEPPAGSVTGRSRRLLIGATVATGVVGAAAWLLATSSHTRLTATRRPQSRGALSSSAGVATTAAVGVLHAPRFPRPAATPSRRPGRRPDVDTARATRARPRDAGAHLWLPAPARVISAPRSRLAGEPTSPPVAVPSAASSGPRVAPRSAQHADFTFER